MNTRSRTETLRDDRLLQRVDVVVSDVNATVAELEAVDVLAGAPAPGLRTLATMLTPFTAPPGTTLMRKGETADSFVLLTDGLARVVNGDGDDHEVAVVAEGSIVGEIALLRGRPRANTVTAVTAVSGLMGGRAAFTQLLAIQGVADNVVTRARRRLAADGTGPRVIFDIDYDPPWGLLGEIADRVVFEQRHESDAERVLANLKALCEKASAT